MLFVISSSFSGELHPDEIDLPGIYVQKIVKGERYEKRIEKLTLRKTDDSEAGATTNVSRDRIVRRAAKEFKDGMYVNLGKITTDTKIANNFFVFSENLPVN